MINFKRWFSIALVSGLAVLLLGILAVTPAFAQGPGWMMEGPGSGWMMGNTQGYTRTVSYGPGGMMGGGMMHGGMMGGPGWMMSNTQGYTGTVPYGPGGMMGGGMIHRGMMGGHGWMMGNTQGYAGTVPYGPGGMMGGGMMHGDGWQHHGNNWGMMPGYGYSSDLSTLRATVPSTTTTAVSFKTDVQPIFEARCVICHGGTAGLVLNNYENILRGGMHGSAVLPGDPVNSRLIQYVSSGYMPAGGPPLTPSQIQALVNWVAAGAPDN